MHRTPPTIAAALALLSACYATNANMHAKRAEPDAGTAKVYGGKCELHWDKVHTTITKLGLEVLQENQADGEILARRPYNMTDMHSADRVAIWLDNDPRGCRIRVYSRSQDATGGIMNGDWHVAFFAKYVPPYTP